MAVVELAGVTKAYENKVAVNNLSLSIDAGQMFGLRTVDGCGGFIPMFGDPAASGHDLSSASSLLKSILPA